MNIHYRILEINKEDHSLVVRYWTDSISEMSLCNHFDSKGLPLLTDDGYPVRCRTDVNITFYNNLTPSQNAINEIIKINAPVEWLNLKKDIKDANVSLDEAIPLLNIALTVEI